MTPLSELLSVPDLTDPAAGPHAIQHVVDRLEAALTTAWRIPVHRHAGPHVVTVRDNYDRLRYPPDAVTRDRTYSHYLGGGRMLRSHTTAHIPALLDRLAATGVRGEVLLSVPGMCYRRDVIDRRHVGQPHQIDLWRIRTTGPALTDDDLAEMINLAVAAVLPGTPCRTVPSQHPYTSAGRQIDAADMEVGECGVAHPALLAACGLPDGASGLAMGLGLDRLTMLAKGIDDIRLLRATDPRVARQMLDLAPYRPVSRMPAVRRDLSIAVDTTVDAELLGDTVRHALGPDAAAVEELTILGETAYGDLPHAARARLGMGTRQKNLLVRLVLRHPTHTLTDHDANVLRDRAYAGLHQGTTHDWTVR